MSQVLIEIRITAFNLLAVSKVLQLVLVKKIQSKTIEQLRKIQKQLMWLRRKNKNKA